MRTPAPNIMILVLIASGGAWPAAQQARAQAAADAEGLVAGLIDAETLEVLITRTVSEKLTGPEGGTVYVRLAHIAAPPIEKPEGVDAVVALIDILSQGGWRVFIEIDDANPYDSEGRILALVMTPYNETHAVNLNLYMVSQGHAVLSPYSPSRFNPSSWSLYTPTPSLQATTTASPAPAQTTARTYSPATATTSPSPQQTATAETATKPTATRPVTTAWTATTSTAAPQETAPGMAARETRAAAQASETLWLIAAALIAVALLAGAFYALRRRSL